MREAAKTTTRRRAKALLFMHLRLAGGQEWYQIYKLFSKATPPSMDGKGGVRGLRRRLKFKKRYLQMILEGRKRSTIRLGRLVLRDRLLTIVGDRGPIALARVDEVIYKKVRELTDEDARVDGFRGLIELFRELRRIYGDFSLEDDVTIIRFTVLRRLDNEGQDLAGLPRSGSSRGSR